MQRHFPMSFTLSPLLKYLIFYVLLFISRRPLKVLHTYKWGFQEMIESWVYESTDKFIPKCAINPGMKMWVTAVLGYISFPVPPFILVCFQSAMSWVAILFSHAALSLIQPTKNWNVGQILSLSCSVWCFAVVTRKVTKTLHEYTTISQLGGCNLFILFRCYLLWPR